MFNRFRFIVILHVSLIVVLSIGLAFLLLWRPSLFLPAVVGLGLIGTVASLIHYLERTNRDLTHFLLSIRQGAFTETYGGGSRGKQYQALSKAMNDIVNEFARLNEQKELHYRYLEALNENIHVSILSFDEGGKLIKANAAAKKLLPDPSLAKIEHFKKIDVSLYKAIQNCQPDQRTVKTVFIGQEQLQLGIQTKEVVIQGKKLKIVLLQNLNSELDEKEIDAWHQLMRVLTHEIMNSVTPILSLSKAAKSILSLPDGTKRSMRDLSNENEEDIFNSISTIESRSNGLLNFVRAFKEYAKPVELKLERTDILALATRIGDLLRPQLESLNISFTVQSRDKTVIANADAPLIEQVLINLIKNAIEAVKHDGTGEIKIFISQVREAAVRVSVHDNGVGIEPELIPKIFIPFFTTKQHGSGIGLSLSRQIIKLHGGSIKVQSSESGSVFVIEW
jgi:two-component system, NtrC family, nitrogen regulation sensor histidine kinase NtrY